MQQTRARWIGAACALAAALATNACGGEEATGPYNPPGAGMQASQQPVVDPNSMQPAQPAMDMNPMPMGPPANMNPPATTPMDMNPPATEPMNTEPPGPQPMDMDPMMEPPGEPTFTAIYEGILTNSMTGNCMAGFCHGAAPGPANGNLEISFGNKDGTHANLVGTESSSPMCGAGNTLVIPGDSANSLLVQKLREDPPCGTRMPVGPTLSDAQIDQIAMWIDMGAENN